MSGCIICLAKFRLKLTNTVLKITRRAHLTVTKSRLLNNKNSVGTKAVGYADLFFYHFINLVISSLILLTEGVHEKDY